MTLMCEGGKEFLQKIKKLRRVFNLTIRQRRLPLLGSVWFSSVWFGSVLVQFSLFSP